MASAAVRQGLAYLLIGLAPMAFSVRGVRESHVISPASLTHVDGASYIASIPPSRFAPVLVAASDDLSHLQRSSARLFEDARELRPTHAVHAGIAAVGKGRFSHWTTAVYLSASDNSDPRTNGRVYRLETVARLPLVVTLAWPIIFVVAAVAFRFWRSEESVLPWMPRVRPIVLVAFSAAAIAFMAIAEGEVARAALASWLIVGLLAALYAGVMISRGSPREFAIAVKELSPAITAAWDRVGSRAASLNQSLFDQPGWQSWVARMACLALPIGIFAATLTIGWPEWVLAQAYAGGSGVILAAAPALWLAHTRRGWLAISFGLAVTLGLFGLALAALWQDVAIHFNALGGLLPFSDAQGYFFEASRLLDGQPLEWSARRPLFPAFLAVLLAATGSLPVALAVMVALNAIGTFLLAREIRISFGAAAATVATLILFAFYRGDGGNGVVLTENLGFLLGTLAFTALLRGMRLQELRGYISGAVVLTAALTARAGAFFVLPSLVAVALFCLSPDDRRRRSNTKAALATICAVAIAATTLLVWGKTLSNPTAKNTAFSNYSYVLYGLAVGGKGWGQVMVDHPDAKEGGEIYKLAYQAFRARPSGLIEGMARMTRAYLSPREPYHMFAFILDGPRTRWLQRLCYLLVVVGFGACMWYWRDPVHAFALAAAVGHFASIPLVPPIDAGLRVYAATIPVLPLLVAAAIGVAGKGLAKFRRQRAKQKTTLKPALGMTSRLAELAALLLVAIIMGASWAVYMAGKPRTSATRPTCSNGSESLVVRVDNDAVVRVEADESPRAISPTASRESELRRTVGVVELKAEAANIRAGMSLRFAYDPENGERVWLVGETRRLESQSGWLQICGHYTTDKTAEKYGLMFVDEAWVAAPPRSR